MPEGTRKRDIKKAVKYGMIADGDTVLEKFQSAKAAGFEGVEMDSQGRAKLTWGTFATGVVHGLQPDSMFLLLPAFAMASKVAAGAFLACFLAGTVIAMGSYSAFLSIATTSIGKRAPGFNNAISKGSSFIAIGLGIVIIISAVMGVDIIALH